MRLTTKQILALGLIAGTSGGVCFCCHHAPSSPLPHLALIVSEKKIYCDECTMLRQRTHQGVSVAISNTGPETVRLEIRLPGKHPDDREYGKSGPMAALMFSRSEQRDLGDYVARTSNKIEFRIQATVQGGRIQRLNRATRDAAQTFWRTANPSEAWNAFNSVMNYVFLGPTYDLVKTVTFDPPKELTVRSE